MDSINQLPQLQADLLNLILGDPALAVVPVTSFKQFVVQAMADEAVNVWTDRSGLGKVGVAIQVRMPAIRARYSNVPGPQLQVEFTIRIMEDPVANNTGVTAESAGLEVLQWLDGQTLEGSSNLSGVILRADEKNLALRPVYDYPDRFAYDAVFVSELPQSYLGRCTLAGLTDDGQGNVTLTNLFAAPQDTGAIIYYTIDGSLPLIPANAINVPIGVPPAGGSTLVYSAPFAVPAGTVVRWLSFNPGFLPSYVGRATISIP